MDTNPQILQKLLDRVKALHKLAASTHSKGEAEAANKAAQQIITRYKIDQVLLREQSHQTTDDPFENVVIFAKHKARILWKEEIVLAVCHTNGCQVLIYGADDPRKNGISYRAFGKRSNLQICGTLIELIIGQIDALAKEDTTVKGKDGKDSFKMGCARRVKERLSEGFKEEIDLYLSSQKLQPAEQTAIVKLNENQLVESRQYMEATVGGNIRSVGVRQKDMSLSEYQKGRAAGNRVVLGKQLK